jgi:hypothetical protein
MLLRHANNVIQLLRRFGATNEEYTRVMRKGTRHDYLRHGSHRRSLWRRLLMKGFLASIV